MTQTDHSQKADPAVATAPHSHNTFSAGTGAILLAAGFSRRFGGVKLQARLPDGSTLLQKSFNNISQATDKIIVVGRADLAQQGTYAFLLQHPTVQLVMCQEAASGMGHSLASAAKAIPSDWRSVLVCLGDMPFISPLTLQAVMAASSEDTIVIPRWQAQRGHPVCFGRRYFTGLAASDGDTGGRHLIKQHSQQIVELDTDDAGVVQDIDTPEALARYTIGT